VANSSLVDAYFWLKTPGESDGCTQTLPEGGTCPRFDADCGAGDALGSRAGEPRAPEAGHWFDHQVKELAAKANFEPPSGSSPPTSGGSSGSGNHNTRPRPPTDRGSSGSGTRNTRPPNNGGSRDGGSSGRCAPDTTTNCMEAGCCKTSGHKCWMKDSENLSVGPAVLRVGMAMRSYERLSQILAMLMAPQPPLQPRMVVKAARMALARRTPPQTAWRLDVARPLATSVG